MNEVRVDQQVKIMIESECCIRDDLERICHKLD
jgi:hypothetical protein